MMRITKSCLIVLGNFLTDLRLEIDILNNYETKKFKFPLSVQNSHYL